MPTTCGKIQTKTNGHTNTSESVHASDLFNVFKPTVFTNR